MKRRILAAAISVATLLTALCGCRQTQTVAMAQTIQKQLEVQIQPPDLSGAVSVNLSSAKIQGEGIEAKDGVVTVTAGGTYVLTGSLAGRIIVNAPKEKVVLVLSGASITCDDGSALYVYKSAMTTLYLADQTENTLSDGSEYTFADDFSSQSEDEPNACLYTKSDLVIAGGGSLRVTAQYKNGITSKDTLRLADGTITIQAKENGINGKDFCVLQNAHLSVDSGADALRSTNDQDKNLGFIGISGSDLTLAAGEDGIQAQTYLLVRESNCTITSETQDEQQSAKGLKAGEGIVLQSGNFTVNSTDDTFHSNGDIVLEGGSYKLKSGDDGIHADGCVSIADGTIEITDSYEGIEGADIEISGGNITIKAEDDGLNAAGGKDGSGTAEKRQEKADAFASSGNYRISISGGVIIIDANGDGIDSNGDLYVSGGEIYVSGPTDNGNGALDYDGTAKITGGIVVAAGSTGMAQNFAEGSTQGSILVNFNQSHTEEIVVTDEKGEKLISFTPSKKYQSVVVSCPKITVGKSYGISAGSARKTVTLGSLIFGGNAWMSRDNGNGPPSGEPSGDNRPSGGQRFGAAPDEKNSKFLGAL